MLETFSKPHPVDTWNIAMCTGTHEDSDDGHGIVELIVFMPLFTIYLAHCSRKALFLQLLRYLLFSFNFTLHFTLTSINEQL